jgi:hypothetical protein
MDARTEGQRMTDHEAPAGCLSSFRIDQLVADELEASIARVARDHLASCARCRGRLAAVENEREAFASSPPLPIPPAVALGVRPQRARTSRRVWWFVAPALAAAGLLLWLSRSRDHGELGDVRTKGASHLELFVEHGGAVRAAGPDEPVAPGDRLQFAYSSADAQFLAIVSIDAAGTASVYYAANDGAAPISAGEHVTVDRSIVLDDTLGTETIYGLFCTRPIAVATVLDDLRAARTPQASGCVVETVRIGKR